LARRRRARRREAMEPSIFRYILKYSKRQQVFIVLVTLASLPFYYASLDVPKLIVNMALDSAPEEFPLPFQILGIELLSLDQKPLLYAYCALFLLLVLINGGFKYLINVMKGILGERMLRRLRYQLLARALRFPLHHFRRVSSGEIIPMVTSEVEPLGGYIGDALVTPLYQGGLLVTAIFFIFAQDLYMGAAAISLYPIQGWLIPKLQRKVNRLGKDRVKEVRKLSERIAEATQSSQEIHAHDTVRWELADFSTRFGRIYDIRYRIYTLKFLAKFLNNFMSQLTPFFFFSIGGYYVIEQQLSLGALVAVLAAYKDLPGPWNELLTYYQTKEDSRIKYQQVVDQFDPPGLRDETLVGGDLETPPPLAGTIETSNLGFSEDGDPVVDALSIAIPIGQRVALVGDASSGKGELTMLLARLIDPTSGRIVVGGTDLKDAPEALTGRRIAYVGPNTPLLSASLADNLTYGLKHRPLRPFDYAAEAPAARRRRAMTEARLSGNAEDDRNDDWIDYAAAGAAAPEALIHAIISVLDLADMSPDVYQFGLRGTIDPLLKPDAARRVLEARAALRELLAESNLADLVEPFDPNRYNLNATVAENLLFGTPRDDTFVGQHLADNAYVRKVLDDTGLTADLLTMGYEVAQTMIELFADLPPEHEFFAQFSFIGSEDLPEYQALLRRAEPGKLDALAEPDRLRLLNLPFQLIPARHRLGKIDEPMRERLLVARRAFAEGLPARFRATIAFFDPATYNGLASLQDNILFGKVAYGKAQAAQRIGDLISQLVEALGLREIVIEAGLDFPAGIGGTRLTPVQRQKLALARALLKRPDMLILNEATASFDGPSQAHVLTSLLGEFEGRTLIWALHRASLAKYFDKIIVLKSGRVAQTGTFTELEGKEGPLSQLLSAE
jgi:ABC-type multidrug transport system fused ATPase/permease subunit